MALVMNIVTLVLDVLQPNNDIGTFFLTLLNAVSANLLARFMLDLRGINEQGFGKSTVSSINFDIRSLGGNIGAPLEIENSAWVTGPADDLADERNREYEEAAVPFRAGLGLDIEEVSLDTGNLADRETQSSADVRSSADIQEIPRNASAVTSNV
ncbi:hypothetical protein EIP91_003883 [Steccherinum ochraceum]|uniref:Uncharacterized protein n=1 Tax=Steccherinum ochraceum TaxID=92696 RepID=A0A4V2MW18_9APHY|nr:hypothetical protein EIP91_003883 [Steccherinum ochraceum]